MKNYLVTGGAGFIGMTLCKRLLGMGHRVVILDNFDPYYEPAIKRFNIASLNAAFPGREPTLVEGDIRSQADLDRAWALGPFDVIVHLAAKAGVRPSIEIPLEYNDVNTNGTIRILEQCRVKGPHRIVFASSSSVYGDGASRPLSEDMRCDEPVSPYAASKRACELYCHAWASLHGLHITALRFFTVYGPGQRPEMAIHKFARLMDRGQEVPMFGDGNSSRDYTFIEDVVDGILLAEGALKGYQLYNLGGGRPVPLRTLIDTIGREMGIEPRIRQLPFQSGDVSHTLASVEKAKAMLGYRAETTIDVGVRAFVKWYLQMKKALSPHGKVV